MKMSLENEIKLKKILQNPNREKDMENLTKEIEYKESKMVKYISEYHMSILDKCNKLVEVKNKVPKILEDNESIISSFEDISIQYSKIEQEIKTYEQLDSRIKKVIIILGKLEEFFKHTSFDYENDALYFYNITGNLIKLRDLRKDFFDFSFYDDLNEIFVKYNNKVKDKREILYKKWKKNILQTSEINGKSILKIFDEDKNLSGLKLIFPEINTLRNELLTTDFLILIWIYKKTDEFEDFIDRLNIDRISIIDGYADKTNALHSYVSEFLLSYFLIQISKGINPHYEELLSSLNKYFFNRSQLNLHDTKDIIIPFRNLLQYIKVEDNILEETIGKLAMDYFETHEFKNGDFTKLNKDQFKNSLKKFLNDSQDFISKIKTNEINDILAKKVDEYLENYIETSDENIEDMNNLVNEILLYCHERNLNYVFQEFQSKKTMKIKIEKYKLDKIKQITLVINELFANKDKDFNLNIQRVCSENKIIEKEIYEIIKLKFKEDVSRYKKSNDKEKRVCLSRISCFCNFLKNFNRNFHEDFKEFEKEAVEIKLKVKDGVTS